MHNSYIFLVLFFYFERFLKYCEIVVHYDYGVITSTSPYSTHFSITEMKFSKFFWWAINLTRQFLHRKLSDYPIDLAERDYMIIIYDICAKLYAFPIVRRLASWRKYGFISISNFLWKIDCFVSDGQNLNPTEVLVF